MDFVLLDYTTLRVIWWLLLGILLIGFAVMDGFDLGVGTLLPFVARNDDERRLVVNTIGPVWEGNQVWLILGGGAIFAAWPPLYAVSFSGFYLAMFLILFALILRPVGFKYRGKLPSQRWRDNWDWALFIGGFVPALIMGVAVGNVLLGVPYHFDDSMRIFYTGSFFGLLMPFALLAGLLSVSMLVAHGAARPQGVRDAGLLRGVEVEARLDALGLLVGQETAGAEGPTGAAAGEGRQAVGEVGGPPAADGLVADTQEVGEFQLGVAQLDPPPGAQAQRWEGFIGQLAGVG